MARLIILVALLIFGLQLSSARDLRSSELQRIDLCEPCLMAVKMVEDVAFSPQAQNLVLNYLENEICAKAGSMAPECNQYLSMYVNMIFNQVRTMAQPQALCADAHVCPPPKLAHIALLGRQEYRDATDCSVCTLIATKVKEVTANTTAVEEIKQVAQRVCTKLPPSLTSTCAAYLQTYEQLVLDEINSSTPSQLCNMVGACRATSAAGRLFKPDLRSSTATLLPPLPAELVQQLVTVMAQATVATPSNDACATCKVIVTELHTFLADPRLQQQIIGYVKSLCKQFPAVSDTCTLEVDQYAPLIIGFALAYLQPATVCAELDFCPPPSLLPRSLPAWREVLVV